MTTPPPSFPVLSRSQRHFFCEAAKLPLANATAEVAMDAIRNYATRCNLSNKTVFDMINATRRGAQYKADMLNTTLLKDSFDAGLTGLRILKTFSNYELTRLAFKLRMSRVYCTRVFIAFELAETAQANALSIYDLNTILSSGVRQP